MWRAVILFQHAKQIRLITDNNIISYFLNDHIKIISMENVNTQADVELSAGVTIILVIDQ